MTGARPSSTFANLRVGYTPFSADLSHPADRRRFPAYARARGIPIEAVSPEKQYDLIVVTRSSDLTRWGRLPTSSAKLIFDLADTYHNTQWRDFRGLLRGTAKFLAAEHAHWEPNFVKTINRMCRRADAVICTTKAQRVFWSAMQPNMHLILDIHTDIIRTLKTDYATGPVARLVWEGLPENIIFLKPALGALKNYMRSPIESTSYT
jgi:hypothetical protein